MIADSRTNFAPPEDNFAAPPCAKFCQNRPTPTHQVATSKQLAASARGEIGRISLHEKKEKNLSGAKIGNWPRWVPLALPVLLRPGLCGWSYQSNVQAC
jgi:hypothetical protein